MPFSVEFRVGRLFESRVDATMTLEEMQALRTRTWALLGGMTGRIAAFSDMSRAARFDPEVERRLVEMFRLDNAKLTRSAIYWGSNDSAFTKQMEQIITASNALLVASGRPIVRRGFSDGQEAARWLGEILDEPERARLREIVGPP